MSLSKIGMTGMKDRYIKNPMAKDLRQPKYKQRAIPDRKKGVVPRKKKHKGKGDRRMSITYRRTIRKVTCNFEDRVSRWWFNYNR